MRKIVLFFACVIVATNIFAQQVRYKVATWNLEHFKDGKERGFPEYNDSYDPPGPVYPKRENENYEYIAQIILDQKFKIVALQEINGKTNGALTGIDKHTSRELDKLVTYLGDSWQYVIGTKGGSQRVAILYDNNYAEGLSFCELNLPDEDIQGKGLFDRQPLAGYFKLIKDGEKKNDLVMLVFTLLPGKITTKTMMRL